MDTLSETSLREIPYYTTLENRRAKRGGGSTEVAGGGSEEVRATLVGVRKGVRGVQWLVRRLSGAAQKNEVF